MKSQTDIFTVLQKFGIVKIMIPYVSQKFYYYDKNFKLIDEMVTNKFKNFSPFFIEPIHARFGKFIPRGYIVWDMKNKIYSWYDYNE